MSTNEIYIPFPRDLYDDIIRFSDGGLDPADLAENEVLNFIERTMEISPLDHWVEDRLEEALAKYAPRVLERWEEEEKIEFAKIREENRPLVWKEITVLSGSKVRMSYGNKHYYAEVKHTHILDDGKEYSPSEWARKIANNTSRNAWRDLWFKEPLSKTWIPAQLMRNQAYEQAKERASKALGNIEISDLL